MASSKVWSGAFRSLMHTGKILDALTGLYYFAARFYDDATGRFMAEDSNSGSQDDPLSLNRYVYAQDRPMKFTDPTGHLAMIMTGSGPLYSTVVRTSSGTTTTSTSAQKTTTAKIAYGHNASVLPRF